MKLSSSTNVKLIDFQYYLMYKILINQNPGNQPVFCVRIKVFGLVLPVLVLRRQAGQIPVRAQVRREKIISHLELKSVTANS